MWKYALIVMTLTGLLAIGALIETDQIHCFIPGDSRGSTRNCPVEGEW